MKSLILGIVATTALIASEASAQGYCREYSQGVSIGGQHQSSYGVACMQPDGSWQVVSSNAGAGYNGGGYGYAQPAPVYVPAPRPVPVAVPVYRPVNTGFSVSFGVPMYYGRGDCDDRRWGGWRRHKHHGHGGGHHRW